MTLPKLPPLHHLFLNENDKFGAEVYGQACYAKGRADEGDWKSAVLDALAVSCVDMPVTATPAEIIAKIIAVRCCIALDPQVSEDAAALVSKGRADGEAKDESRVSAEWLGRRTDAAYKQGRADLLKEIGEPVAWKYLASYSQGNGQPPYSEWRVADHNHNAAQKVISLYSLDGVKK